MKKETGKTPFSEIRHIGRRSISRDLTISLILLVILFEAVLLVYVYNRQSRILRRELEKKADDFAVNLAEVLVVPIWDFDEEQVAKIGVGFARNDVVDKIQIVDPYGKTLYASRSKHAAGPRIKRTVNIMHLDRIIGRASLFLCLDAYETQLVRLRNAILLVMAVSIVVIFITSGVLLRIFMRKPLGILQDGIDRVAKGDYAYGFDEIRHRELSGIAGRFSEMAVGIQAREKALQEINRALEEEVAERRRAERKIKESEAKSRALLDAMPDIMFQFNRKGIFLDLKGTEDDLAISPETFPGKSIREAMPAQIAGLFMEKLERALNTRRLQIFEYEMVLDGRPAFFECRMVAVTVDVVMAIVRNITASKQAAMDRLRLEEQLRKAQKMEAIGTLAGGVAHDLNNVLSGLASYPELILMDLPEVSPLKAPLLTIQKSGEKAAHIVQDLLTLARRGVSISEVVNLNPIITEYLNSPEHGKLKTYHSNIQIELNLEPDLLNILGSPVHLSKTVMNLVSNAAEAMPDGGRINLSTRNRYIDRPVPGYDDISEGDYVVLQVTDNGIGIARDDVERIFEPFYTKKVMGRSGTGLGMAVVWGTVRDHNGYIDIQSTEGKGATFFTYFPATRQALPQKEPRILLEAYTGNGEFILIIDDVAEQREIASGMLRRLGYIVKAVSSGEAGVAYLEHNAADLIILDMIMDPGIDGCETYKRILRFHPGQKAVIVSGFSESQRVKETMRLGAGTYVKKPYLIEKIAAAVQAELNR